jgi:hypothetical protein
LNNCKNCDKESIGEFCSNCGVPKEFKRINRQYITDEISSVLNLDKGIFYTIKELFIRPGNTVKGFIEGDRKRIVKPIIFLIICSLIYTIAQQFFSFEAGYIKYDIKDRNDTPIMVKIFEWFSKNYGYANILLAVFITFWIKIFFKKSNYNHYEIYILLCFIIGNSILIYTLLGIIESIIDFPILQLGLFINLIYITWAIGQFFGKKKKINYLKGFLSYIFGVVTCLIFFFTIGIGLDIVLK